MENESKQENGERFLLPFEYIIENLTTSPMLNYFKNSIIITVGVLIPLLLISFMAGFALSKIQFRGNKKILSYFLLGLMLPFQVALIPLFTIFSKMGVAYDQLRNAPDSIEIVRKYYREKAIKAKKKAMPWWLGTSAEESLEEHTDMNISLWVDNGEYADPERNKRLKAEIFILFPEVVSGNYENAALWLCTRRSVVNFHMRDTFSAGGQQLKLNDELLPFPLPHVVGELLESATLIKNYLLNSDDLDLDISEFRPELMLPNRYEVWLNDIWKRIHQLKPYKRKETIEELGGISLAEWIDRKYTLSVK